MHVHAYIQPYVHIFIILHFILASSVINIAVDNSSYMVDISSVEVELTFVVNNGTLNISYNVSLELQYNITFYCAVHRDSSAKECEVTARNNSGLTRIGNII